MGAGDYLAYEIESSADGYINYEFQSVKSNNPSEFLDIGFRVSNQEWILFQADKLTFIAASMQVKKGEEYHFLFDNTSSLFADKEVTFALSHSDRPSHPRLPNFGEYEGSDICNQIESTLDKLISAVEIENLIALAIATYSGDWLRVIVEGLMLSAAIYEANTEGDTALNQAGYAIAVWGCGNS